jgi:predicted DNA-binding transcriptional regulator YafY
MARSTNAQKFERLNAAHRLLAGGTRVADAAALLAEECGISLRHAYRYIEEAQALRRPVPIPVASIPEVAPFCWTGIGVS